MSESQEQTPAQKLIGTFLPKMVSLTDDVLFGDIWERKRPLETRSELDYRCRFDRRRKHRTTPRSSDESKRQWPDGDRTQRGDHPSRVLCWLAQGHVGHLPSPNAFLTSNKRARSATYAETITWKQRSGSLSPWSWLHAHDLC